MHRFRTIASRHRYWRSALSSATAAAASCAAASCAAAVAPPLYHRALFKRTLILQIAAEPVRIDRLSGADSGIIELKLDRPEVKNAISKGMLRGLQDAVELIAADESARVVMVCSAVPGFFCAGADLKERRLMNTSEVQLYVDSLRATLSSIEVLPVPTIAVIEGPALGGGLELALSCDLRICGEDAIFGMPETGLAVIPGAGGTQRLPRVVGKSVAKELIFTCRRIDGKEAKSIGLVSHCTPSGDAYLKSIQIAREINQKGPLAIRMAKQAIDRGMEVEITEALAVEGECYDQLLDTDDRLEGLAAVAEKRKPRYTGIPWTEEEHKTFLAGLKKHGKGDWRGISRDYVPTRTPTQVASHAQKYFLRHSNPNKKKRRCSLFDVVIDETATNEGSKGTDHPIRLCQDEHSVGSLSFNTIQSLSRGIEPLPAKVDYNKTPSSESVNLMLEISSSKTQCLPSTPMFYPNSVSFDPDFLKLTLSSSYSQAQCSSASQLLDNSDLELTIAPPQLENLANSSSLGVAGVIRVA